MMESSELKSPQITAANCQARQAPIDQNTGSVLTDHDTYTIKVEHFDHSSSFNSEETGEIDKTINIEIYQESIPVATEHPAKQVVFMKNFNLFEPPGQFFLINGVEDDKSQPLPLVDQSIKCPICSKCFNKKNDLHKHVIDNHPTHYGITQEISCAQCKTKFASLSEMDCHWADKVCTPDENDTVNSVHPGCRFCTEFPNKSAEAVLWHEATQHQKAFQSRKLQCSFCLHHFSSFAQYNQHIMLRQCLNICTGCSMVFPKMAALAVHINKKHMTDKYEVRCLSCRICQTKFDSVEDQVGHICPKYCPHCDITFSSYTLFFNHLNETHSYTGFVCGLCGAICLKKTELEAHMKKRHCWKCTHCQQLYKTKTDLQAHTCPMQPLPPVTYSIHVPVPVNEKPRQPLLSKTIWCNLCNNVFSECDYNDHVLDDTCLGCRLCSYVASENSNIVNHILREHSENLSVSANQNSTVPSMLKRTVVYDDSDVSHIFRFCVGCKQLVTSETEFEETHKVWIECIQCKTKMQCKVCYMKHVATEHSSFCKICKKYFDFQQLHSLKRHQSGPLNVQMDQSLSLFTCSQCNVNAFDKEVLMKKQGTCQHIGSLWEFQL